MNVDVDTWPLFGVLGRATKGVSADVDTCLLFGRVTAGVAADVDTRPLFGRVTEGVNADVDTWSLFRMLERVAADRVSADMDAAGFADK